MPHHIGYALTVVGAVISVPIVVLNCGAPIVSIVWLGAVRQWEFIFAGLLAVAAAQVVFGLMLQFVPIIARSLLSDMRKAIHVLKLFRAALFFLLLFYSIYVFRLALTEAQLPLWLRLSWAYTLAVTPFAIIGFRGRNSDPMLVIWPTAASYGAIAAVIALLTGEAVFASIAQVCGSLVGLYLGWRVGMRRVFARLRRMQPAY